MKEVVEDAPRGDLLIRFGLKLLLCEVLCKDVALYEM